MKQTYGIIIAAFLTAVTGCREYEERAYGEDGPVSVDMALAVSDYGMQGTATRLSADMLQLNNVFRGMEDFRIIPFKSSSELIGADDLPRLSVVTDDYIDGRYAPPSRFCYFRGCTFMSGVNAFLFYGHALRETTGNDLADHAANGALEVVSFNMKEQPSTYKFKLKTIHPSTDVPDEASQIADYLTDIANTEADGIAWRNSVNTLLSALYKLHVFQLEDGSYGDLAGSSANAKAHVASLEHALRGAPLTGGAKNLSDAILAKIEKAYPGNYPASIGLPDGAAVLRWDPDELKFKPQTQTTTMDNINSISRYAYPAELWYYGNTRIKASPVADSVYHTDTESWAKVLKDIYYVDNAAVNATTRAIALRDSIQYAVARLELKLKGTAATLKDGKDEDVAIAADAFPLTGVIVGGQYPVRYDFTPVSSSDYDALFTYDRHLTTATGGSLHLTNGVDVVPGTVSTLVLQSNDGEDIPLILEFENQSQTDFTGLGGSIRPGTKFYLVGTIDHDASKVDDGKDYTKRVFTKDYTTTVTLTVSSLAKAYNVLPNLLKGELEIGIQITTDWVLSSTSYAVLK